MKPRIFFDRGMWRCRFEMNTARETNVWQGMGDTPREAWDSMLRLMGKHSWLVSQGAIRERMLDTARRGLL